MPKNFIANFSLEKPETQNAEFEIKSNKINIDFNVSQNSTINATFGIEKQVGGDKYFIFEQGVSSAEWHISHNLNKKPSVTVVDEYERVVVPAVEYINDYEIILRFNFAFKGKAYLN